MRILYITAGAGDMICGSCLADNALAAELMAQGHQVTLLPLYTPTRTDGPNVSQDRVFFGGISVFLEQKIPLFRSLPRFLDRLWDSPWVIRAATRRWVRTDPRLLGELTISVLRGEEGLHKKELRKLCSWLQPSPPPDNVILPNSLLIGLAEPLKRFLNRPVVCNLQGEDLFLGQLLEPYRSQAVELIRAQINSVDLFVAPSEHHARVMAEYLRIPRDKMRVVPLGVNPEAYTKGSGARSETLRLGYLARVTPEKGLHVLCEAYRLMRQAHGLPAGKLEAAGYLGHDYRDYLAGIERRMKDWGLGDEFQYRGILDRQEKLAFLQSLDIFSVPCTYDDPKGMYLLEAMASGIPVVEPRRGALTEIIEKTGGGLLVPPDDPEALALGILSIWKDPDQRAELGRKGAEGVRSHYNIAHTAKGMIAVYKSLGGAASPPKSVPDMVRSA